MDKASNPGRGIILMLLAVMIFAVQDAISRHLVESYNVWFVMMIRFQVMFAAVMLLAMKRGPDFRSAIRSGMPRLQIFRSVLLVAQTCLIVTCFTKIGLINTHAIFASAPLIGAALSVPILGEKVGWRRWLAIGVGFIGVLIILQPGADSFSLMSLLVLISSFMFATYGVVTRLVSRTDSAAVSLFWVGFVGGIVMTPPGLANIEPIALADWPWMAVLCVTGMLAHWLMIMAFEAAEPSVIQPFAYTQLVFVSFIGVIVFNEELKTSVLMGTPVVIGAGLFTIWRTAMKARAEKRASLLHDGGN
ncbi:DMT family transporter [Falsigemmobacter faecalis]|uniref:DMT family transporter n=1 Tax=Falsigemmobacter faecalis TaxID=2488730 RepID=A0A3P3DKD7_9RHOB|nr:DMT family transporter [Falsigemmobacter faecalis]RRH74717.1 DMT family transporter [Falsigemmobacter faecalis]